MYVISARNVCEALPVGLEHLMTIGQREESRAGPVIVAPWPVTTEYTRPQERVLFSPVRDANPFFHLAEALWMLAGRDDAAFLNNFIRDFGTRFAEPNGRIHGAYGHRWRHALGFDQLAQIVETLKKNPASRQCVLQMWDGMCEYDTTHIGSNDLGNKPWDGPAPSWRDRPCNTHAYLRVRQVEAEPMSPSFTGAPTMVLDLTVCCRSNDIIMGAYGANAVHFSVLQEYLAAMIGVGVGTYYQVSNNFHAYEADLKRLTSRIDVLDTFHVSEMNGALVSALQDDRYDTTRSDRPDTVSQPMPLVSSPATFDVELHHVLGAWEDLHNLTLQRGDLKNDWLAEVAWPVLQAHRAWRERSDKVGYWLVAIRSDDWRVACTEWIERRRK